MRFGFWLPVFGGWLRNVEQEGMEPSWDYVSRLARRSEQIGFDVTLIAELNLNDIKGIEAPALDAWTTTSALAAVTESLELMVAVRPTFHEPALLAKQAANIDRISGGRLTINLVSSWWEDEALQYGVGFDRHDDRYARSSEWLEVVSGMWSEERFSFAGDYYNVAEAILEPKPVQKPRPIVYAGGESPRAKEMISKQCDAYLMHGDPPATVADKIADMRARRASLDLPDLVYGVSGFAICRDTEDEVAREYERVANVSEAATGFENFQQWLAGTELEQELQVQDYSVSNRGLKSGLVGTPEQLVERLRAFEAAGVDLVLLQFSPQYEEMERFSESVIARYNGA